MNPAQFDNCIKGYQKRLDSMTKLQDGLNYMLGQYIMTGAHDPKKYPKKPYLQKEKKRWLEEDELIARAKAITKRLGGQING